MGRGYQSIEIVGNLGKDPASKKVGESTVTEFSVAVDMSYKKDGETVPKTEWFNVVAWRKLGDICAQWLKKGQQVHIVGKMETRSWEKDGAKQYRTELIADEMLMLGSAGGGVKVEQHEAAPAPESSEQLPF